MSDINFFSVSLFGKDFQIKESGVNVFQTFPCNGEVITVDTQIPEVWTAEDNGKTYITVIRPDTDYSEEYDTPISDLEGIITPGARGEDGVVYETTIYGLFQDGKPVDVRLTRGKDNNVIVDVEAK